MAKNNSYLEKLERIGNKLPDPAVLFVVMGILILILSFIGGSLGWSVVNPATGETVKVVNLLSYSGIRDIINKMLTNLLGFSPIASVITIMIGIGVAEGTGMLKALLTISVSKLPRNIVILALIFISMGQHPFIGIAAVYAAVAAGFHASIFLCTGDVLLAGITETAAKIIDKNITINPAVNYYFMAISCFPLTLVGTFVTNKFIIPRYKDMSDVELGNERLNELTDLEIKGLKRAGIAFLILVAIIIIGILPNGVLRDPSGTIIPSPLINGTVFFVTILFLIPSIVYGKTVGNIKKDSDAVRMAANGISSISSFLVLAFVASQFISWFGWSNLGIFIAINGAEFLKSIGLTSIPLAVCVVLLCSIINIFMGSQVAKWALVSSVFVPMLMLLGFEPALTQVLYRIGDSVTNPISPLFQFFPIILSYLKKYNKDAGIGTAFTLMLPYSISFLITWIIMLVIWILLNIPLGPEGYIWMR